MGRGNYSYIRKSDKEYVHSFSACAYCGSPDNLSIDHINSLVGGGHSNRENLTIACMMCNSLKWTYSIDVFLKRIIDKRNILRQKTLSYLYRFDYIREGWNTDLINWLMKKINANRKKHTYYTSIIHSITNKKYVLINNNCEK